MRRVMAERRLLYYITDRSQLRGNDAEKRAALLTKAGEAAKARVDYIQLRERDLTTRWLEELARDLVQAVHENSAVGDVGRLTRVLINSRTDVALAVGADGVHLRSEDISPRDVRKIVAAAEGAGREFIVAASCHSKEDAVRAAGEGADFVVFAPVFGKQGIAGAPPAGLSALGNACECGVPVLALGGVTLENAASCFAAGASGVAGIRLFQESRVEDVVGSVAAKFKGK
jgi:thiamine-phosphate pyrophosphorylase